MRGPIMAEGGSRKFIERVRSMSPYHHVAAILLVGIVVYGSFIVVDGLIIRQWLDSSFGTTPDLAIYQERTSLILNGGLIYRDLDIEAPPLINYLLLPAQIIGGEWWAYEIYFSLFPILTSLGIYAVMRRWDDHRAFLAALLFVICPFAVQDATWGIQDEPMVAFFYILPVLLLLGGHARSSAVAVAVGFWTKFLPIVTYPITLLSIKGTRERLLSIGLVILVSGLVALPFLILAPEEFLRFPSYYLLGRSGEGSAGMSIINLIGVGGWHLPGEVGAGLTVAALLLSYYLFKRWKLDVWRGAMLTTVMFISVYPMIRLGYFILPFAFFSLWAVQYKGIALRLIPMYVTLLFGQGFERASPGFDYSFSWLLGLVLVTAGILIMLDITRLCLKRPCLLDEAKREGLPSA